jgi:hypothetical protein
MNIRVVIAASGRGTWLPVCGSPPDEPVIMLLSFLFSG